MLVLFTSRCKLCDAEILFSFYNIGQHVKRCHKEGSRICTFLAPQLSILVVYIMLLCTGTQYWYHNSAELTVQYIVIKVQGVDLGFFWEVPPPPVYWWLPYNH